MATTPLFCTPIENIQGTILKHIKILQLKRVHKINISIKQFKIQG